MNTMNTQELRKLADACFPGLIATTLRECADKIDQLQAGCEKFKNQTFKAQAEYRTLSEAYSQLQAELAALEKQEPVAEIHSDSLRWLVPDEHPAHEVGQAYLYLSAGAQPREPMTKGEMADMFKAVGIDGYDEREKLVRAVEAHHKIGAKE